MTIDPHQMLRILLLASMRPRLIAVDDHIDVELVEPHRLASMRPRLIAVDDAAPAG